jgi:hypothetical protein
VETEVFCLVRSVRPVFKVKKEIHPVHTLDASIQVLELGILTDGLAVDERRIERKFRERRGELLSHFRVPGHFEEEATVGESAR